MACGCRHRIMKKIYRKVTHPKKRIYRKYLRVSNKKSSSAGEIYEGVHSRPLSSGPFRRVLGEEAPGTPICSRNVGMKERTLLRGMIASNNS